MKVLPRGNWVAIIGVPPGTYRYVDGYGMSESGVFDTEEELLAYARPIYQIGAMISPNPESIGSREPIVWQESD